jgi:hypothetical protein
MRILFIANWNIRHCDHAPSGVQAPDYVVNGNDYWFFKYISKGNQVDVLGTECSKFSSFEKKHFRFYIRQACIAFKSMKKYDLILSHGAQSGIFLAFLRKIFGKKGCRHVLIDVGAFQSASEKKGLIPSLKDIPTYGVVSIIF